MRLTRENFQRAISEARKNDDDYTPTPFSFGIPNAIDDFGIEGKFYDYGNPHIVFSEIVDGIEKHGTLLIATTNLTMEEIKAKYGLRTFDRLRAIMQVVVVREKSLRGKHEKIYKIN